MTTPTTHERLLLISGPVGVGKTTVANELSTLLESDDVPHTFVDLDALTHTFPRSASDPFGNDLALENLAVVWQNSRRRGSRNLVVPRVVETQDDVKRISEAAGIPDPVVCRLTASDQTLLQRVQTREIGSSLEWHEKRSLELSAVLAKARLEDFSVPTDDRSITEIATQIMRQICWFR